MIFPDVANLISLSFVRIFSSYSTKSKHFVFLLKLNLISFSVFLSTNSNVDGLVLLILRLFFAASKIDLYSITKRILFLGLSMMFNFAESIIPNVPSEPIIIL